jgi:superoxide dismutase
MVGFACAVGMEFISHHHHDHHKHHHHKTSDKPDDRCCNKNVIKFSQLDKLLIQSVNTGIESPVAVIYLPPFYLSWLAPSLKTEKQIPRQLFFDPPDIRVSIQSFQI